MVTKIFEPIVALARAEPIPSLAVGELFRPKDCNNNHRQ